jgi:hypothetical protein
MKWMPDEINPILREKDAIDRTFPLLNCEGSPWDHGKYP